jgi:hypothetical protein
VALLSHPPHLGSGYHPRHVDDRVERGLIGRRNSRGAAALSVVVSHGCPQPEPSIIGRTVLRVVPPRSGGAQKRGGSAVEAVETARSVTKFMTSEVHDVRIYGDVAIVIARYATAASSIENDFRPTGVSNC